VLLKLLIVRLPSDRTRSIYLGNNYSVTHIHWYQSFLLRE